MTRIKRAVALASVLLSTGCYRYVPADLATISPNSYARVYLTRRGLAAIPEGIPMSTTFVYGRIAQQTRDSLLMQIPVSNSIEGGGLRDLAQNVYVPLGEVISVDRRQFSGGRTGLAVVAGVSFVSLTVLGISNAGGASEGDPGNVNPNGNNGGDG